MWIDTSSARLALAARRSLRLKAARGTRLRAVQGTLWVTIDHDPRDIVLGPGDSFIVDSDLPVVAMPIGACASVDIKGPAAASRAPWWRGWWSRPAGSAAQAVQTAPA